VNITKENKQTNMCASTTDRAVRLILTRKLCLEQDVEFINDDKLVEVTLTTTRLRKRTCTGEHASEAVGGGRELGNPARYLRADLNSPRSTLPSFHDLADVNRLSHSARGYLPLFVA